MLDKWHKKEKPVFTGIARGIGGFGFGIPSAGAAGGGAYTQNSGGSISNYEDGGTYYRAHIFTAPGELVIDDPDLIGQNLEYLIVAGGGGGASRHGGGGGAGGMYVSPGFPGVPTPENQGGNLTVPGPGIIAVTVGKGGERGTGPSSWTDSAKTTGHQGGPTYFGPPGSKLVEVIGGGGGGGYPHPTAAHPRMPGGSGGGGGNMPSGQTGGTGNYPGGVARMGHPGGNGGPANTHYTGGGGGAGGSGVSSQASTTGPGGPGRQVWIAEPSSTPAVQASVGAPNTSNGFTGSYFAGGGGGGGETGGTGVNGGGNGAPNNDTYGYPGLPNTGGGGGGARTPTAAGGGRGGSGIAIVRYQIPGSQGTAQASGGVISFYNGKTIHAFHGPGRFVTASPITGCEIVLIGGGGGGGSTDKDGSYSDGSGGGGAGAFIKKSNVTISGPSDIVIGKGGTGATAFAGKNADINHNNGSGSPSTAAGRGENGWVTTGFGYTADGGGGGGNGGSSDTRNGHTGASGGGAARHPATGGATNVSQFYPGPKDASADTPNNGWGHPGGATGQPGQRAGGGGGAGRNGWDATNSQVRSWTPQGEGDTKGCGGAGMQLPATFRDPNNKIGARGPTNVSSDNPGVSGLDNSGWYWVCGGGGGGADFGAGSGGQGDKSPGGGEGPGVNPWSGGGCGGGHTGDPVMGAGTYPGAGGNAYENTGGGGGGSSGAAGGPNSSSGGSGGSGLVLVAYPT